MRARTYVYVHVYVYVRTYIYMFTYAGGAARAGYKSYTYFHTLRTQCRLVEPALARAEMGAQLLFEILLWLLFILSAIPTVQSKHFCIILKSKIYIIHVFAIVLTFTHSSCSVFSWTWSGARELGQQTRGAVPTGLHHVGLLLPGQWLGR